MAAWSETDEGKAKLKALAANDVSLTKLNAYNDMSGATPACYLAVLAALAGNTALKELNFCFKSIPDEVALAVAKALRTNKGVTDLVLGMNPLSDDACAAIFEALAENSTVKSVDLSSTQVGDKSMKALADTLSGAGAKSGCCIPIGKGSRGNTTLKQVRIDRRRLGPAV